MLQMQRDIASGCQTWNRYEQLDVLEALLAHVRVKKRLLNYIEGHAEEPLEAEAMHRDGDCALGQWLQGEGGTIYADNPLVDELRCRHGEFHHQAAEIVRAVDRGEREWAMELLQHGSYASTSRRMNALLARISLDFEF